MSGALLHPTPLADFIRDHWCRAPLLSPPVAARLELLRGWCHDWSLEHLMQNTREPIRVLLQNPAEPHAQIAVGPEEAMSLYRAGMTLYVSDAPAFGAAADAFSTALGVPRERVRAGVFATRRGNHTHRHYDANENITFQLNGRKIWSLAPNDAVEHPLDNWLGDDLLGRDGKFYRQHAPPTRPPPAAEAVALEPGSLLYLPRGHWHATDADEDSLSLNIALRPVCWYELVSERIYDLMIAQPRWREVATGWGRAAHEAEVARGAARLTEMLRALASELTALDPSAMLDHARPSGRVAARYTRNPFATMEPREAPREGGRRRIAVVSRGVQADDHTTVLDLDEVALAAAHWISHRTHAEAFTLDDLLRQGGLTDEGDAAELLRALETANLITAGPLEAPVA